MKQNNVCSGERARAGKTTKVTGKKELAFYEFSLGKSWCRKGSGLERESMGSHLLTCSRIPDPCPAASRRPRSEAPCKQRAKHTHLRAHLSWEGNPDPSCSSPEASRGMLNNGFSFLPCGANMERQVESALRLHVRRLLIMPALQMT